MFEVARIALYTKVQALQLLWTAYPLTVEYDNRMVLDLSQLTQPQLCVSLEYVDGFQVDLGSKPLQRFLGVIHLEAKTKTGSGRRAADLLLEHFYPSLQMTGAMTPLRTRAAVPLPSRDDGSKMITTYPMNIPFWHDAAIS